MYFTDLAIQIIADDKIRSAIKRGEFESLPGLGRPLPFDDCDDPDWWIRRKLRDEGLYGEAPIREGEAPAEPGSPGGSPSRQLYPALNL